MRAIGKYLSHTPTRKCSIICNDNFQVGNILPEQREALAQKMGHSQSTQQRHYNDATRGPQAARMSGVISKIMMNMPLSAADLEPSVAGI